MKRRTFAGVASSLVVAAVLIVAPHIYAQSSSTNYKVEESFFGTGGELDPSSPNFKAKQSAGETAVGNSVGTQYQFNAGFNTSDAPLLELAVDGGVYDLGVLDAAQPRFTSANFSVRNYLSQGYTVQFAGQLPQEYNGHTLAPMSTVAQSTPGTEQFGINLRDNTTPNVGNDPVQIPDNTYSFGDAVNGYDTPNWFKFVDGDVIAASTKSSGKTSFTISFVANISNDTPAGEYGGVFSVIVTPTF
jgi:hypothetical protein